MKRKIVWLALVLVIAFALTSSQSVMPVAAQSGGGYDLTWNVIAGGGITFSAGGSYLLGGTMGQPDAGTMSGGAYTLNGGFWVDFLGNRLYLPIIEK